MAQRSQAIIDRVLRDPAASTWLKTALQSALTRDCVDAANDAEALAAILAARATELLTRPQR